MAQDLRKVVEAEKKAYSVEGFGAAFGIGKTKTYEEINTRRLKSYKVGKSRRISAEAAAEWQRAREAEAMGEVA